MARNAGKVAEAYVDLVVRMDKLQAQFTEARKVTERSSKRMADSIDRVDGRLGRAAATAASFGKAFAALGAGAAIAGLVSVTKQAISAADALAKTADKVGFTIESLQELRFAAERSGVAQQTLDLALQRFSRRVGEAAQGTGELKDTLAKYNVQVRDSAGNLRNNVDILKDLADVIAGTKEEQERLRIAFKAFDSEGAALVNLLRDGSAGIEELSARARELGGVLSEDSVRAAEAADDALTDLSTALGAVGNEAFEKAIPAIKRLTEFLAGDGLKIVRTFGIAFERLFANPEEKSLDTVRFELALTTDAIAELQTKIKELNDAGFLGQRQAAFQGLDQKLEELQTVKGQLEARIAFLTAPTPNAANGTGQTAIDRTFGPTPEEARESAAQAFNAANQERKRLAEKAAQEAEAAAEKRAQRLAEIEGRRRFDNVAVGDRGSIRFDAPIGPEQNPLQGPTEDEVRQAAAESFNRENELRKEAIRQQEELNDLTTVYKDLAAQSVSQFASGIADVIVEGGKLKDTLNQLAQQIIKTFIQIGIQRAIIGAIGGAGFSALGGGGASVPAAANGAVLSGKGITGGKPMVVSKPTIFPMAAGGILAGEAGTEVILPLSRSRIGGLLRGLSDGGGRGGDTMIQVFDQRQSGERVQVRERDQGGRRVIEVAIRDEVNRMARTGALDNAMGSFGASRQPVRR